MKGIKIGNIMMFRNSKVCIINNIVSENGENIIEGRDCNNFVCRGKESDWKTILQSKEELRHFEEKIFDNILSRREVEAR